MSNGNEVAKYDIMPEVLDRILERDAALLSAERRQHEQALMWPAEINRMLVALAHVVADLRERIASLEARLAGSEA